MKFEKLGNIAEIIAGQSPPSSSYNKNGDGFPFFQGKTDYGKINPFTRIWCNQPTKISLPGDILISVRAPVGPVNINNVKACIGRGLSAIRVKNNISRDYVFYFLKTNEKKISKLGVGSTFTAITQKDLQNIIIPIQPYTDQLHIANILSQAENLIAQRKESIRLLDEFLKSTFLEMFGTQINPKYQTGALENYAIKITDGTHQSPQFIDSGVPFLLVSNIVNNEIVYETKKFISEKEFQELNKRTPIEKGDILLTSVGSYGNPAIVKTITKFAFQRHIAYIKPDKSKINNGYLFGAIKSDFVQVQIEKVVRGVAQKTLNLSDLKKINIPIPPIAIQTQFAQIVESTEVIKAQYQSGLQELENLYASLSQRAFRGELVAKDGEMMMAAEAVVKYQNK